MPKRTNEFQKLIYLIQNQLTDNATVSESQELEDVRTGAQAEVDIVIKSTIGEIEIVIGIECTSKGRPATVEWVREMIGKHQDLPINKSILVSRSGFTKEALKKAASHDFEAITIEEANDTDWVGIIDNLKDLELGSFEFKVLSVNVEYKQEDPEGETLLITKDPLVFEEGKSTPYTLIGYANSVLSNQEIGSSVIQKWLQNPKDQRKDYFEFTLSFPPNKKTKIQSSTGKLINITKFEIKTGASVKTTPLALTTGRYKNKKIAYTSASNIFTQSKSSKNVPITITQKGKNSTTGTILLPNFEGTGDKLFTMKFKK